MAFLESFDFSGVLGPDSKYPRADKVLQKNVRVSLLFLVDRPRMVLQRTDLGETERFRASLGQPEIGLVESAGSRHFRK